MSYDIIRITEAICYFCECDEPEKMISTPKKTFIALCNRCLERLTEVLTDFEVRPPETEK